MNVDRKERNPLLGAIVEELNRGIDMIERIDDHAYATKMNGTGSVGGHVRHNLDFITSLLKGMAVGKIDYNSRERDPLVETHRQVAIEAILRVIEGLDRITNEMANSSIFVRSEINNDQWLPSSVLRELEFLHSHTVHHHALIGEKLAGFGIATPKAFGVARSTLEYWRMAETLNIGGKPCHQN